MSGTNLGTTFYDLVVESCTVAYRQSSQNVVLVDPYFENTNRTNDDGVDRTSLINPVINGIDNKYSMFIGGGSLISIGGRMGLNSNTLSKFLYVAVDTKCDISGMDFGNQITVADQIEIGETAELDLKNPINLDLSLLPQPTNKAIETKWSSQQNVSYLEKSAKVSIASAATGTLLADFKLDTKTIYTFKVFSETNNVIRTATELYIEFLAGASYSIRESILFNDGGYSNTFALANSAGGETDITAQNGHASLTLKYKIILMDSVSME
jgi:hypothetical protein